MTRSETPGTETLEPVGSWRLPAWVHDISRPAWIFIWLAVGDLAVELALRIGVSSLVAPDFATLRGVFALVARAVPILLPAAVLWRDASFVPRIGQPLVAGAVLTATAVLLTTAASVVGELLRDPNALLPNSSIALAMRLVVVALTIAGPVLMARAIITLRTAAVSRHVMWAGMAIIALTILYVASFAREGLAMFNTIWIAPPGDDTTVSDYFRNQTVLAVAASFTVVGPSYLAWAIISSHGSSAGHGRAWMVAVAAATIGLAVTGLTLVSLYLATNAPDLASNSSSAILDLTVLVSFAASVLLVGAFAAGFGRADGKSVEGERAAGL